MANIKGKGVDQISTGDGGPPQSGSLVVWRIFTPGVWDSSL